MSDKKNQSAAARKAAATARTAAGQPIKSALSTPSSPLQASALSPSTSATPEKTIVKPPTRKSLAAHVASTIHYFASEVSARSGGPRSQSNASHGSKSDSMASEPPLTHAHPPTSSEEMEEQLDRVLYAIDQLQKLQQHGRYISAREVHNLRRAFLFAVGEEHKYHESVVAEATGNSLAYPSPSTSPGTLAKRGSRKHKKGSAAAAAVSFSHAEEEDHGDGTTSTTPPPRAVSPHPMLPLADTGEMAHEEEPIETPAESVTTGMWLSSADPPAAASGSAAVASTPPATPASPPRSPGLTRHQSSAKHGYSPKAAAADRLLCGLERYVAETPKSSTFDVNGAQFSWRSIFRTPGERRLQVLVVSLFIFFTGIPISCFITLLLMCSRYTAPFMILYLIWIFTFGKPRHPHKKNPTFAHFFLWRYYRDYFPIRLFIPRAVRRQFDRTRNYFFVYHPHGIHTFGALVNFGLDVNDVSDMLPGIEVHLQTLSVNLYVPFWRQLVIWMGAGDASSWCIRKTLRSGPGQSIMLVVGGAEESLLSKPNANDLLLLKRKGFIKIALQEGTPLVPVYGFGENNVYNVAELASEPDVQHLLALVKRYIGFAIPLVVGRGFFNFDYGVLPHRRPIAVVVGDPIDVPKIANPTSEDLEKWQGKYIEGLKKLFDQHRGIYDLEATGLRIMRMVLFSTYRSKRVVAKGFLNGPVMRARAFADYYMQRPWSSSAQWVIPGEMRFWACGIPVIYFFHRWHTDHSLDVDGVEKAMLMRWGGTLEDVRKLSPQDQLRIKAFTDIEKLFSAYGPKDTIIQPDGNTLPGKDYYHKPGQPHHH